MHHFHGGVELDLSDDTAKSFSILTLYIHVIIHVL